MKLNQNCLLKLVLFFLLYLNYINCDLPVHCLARQIAGEWKFHIDYNFQSTHPKCGHSRPDKNTDHVDKDFLKNYSFKQSQTINLNLQMPNIALENGVQNGKWTMIYDEGFEVKLNDYTFFAFSKYKTINNKVAKDDDDEQSQGYKSFCNETMLGWVSKDNKYSCFYGVKINGQNMENLEVSKYFEGKEKERIVQKDIGTIQSNEQASNQQEILNFQQEAQEPDQTSYNEFQQSENQNLNQQEMPIENNINNEQNRMQENDKSLFENPPQQINKNQQINFQEITKKDGPINENLLDENLDMYGRFKQKLSLYDLPHNEYLSPKKIVNDDELFQPDYMFIQLINSKAQKSPWEAKMYDHYLGKTHKQMKNFLGFTDAKKQKLNHIYSSLIEEKETLDLTQKKQVLFLQTAEKTYERKKLRGFLHNQEQIVLKSKGPFVYENTNAEYMGDDQQVCGKSDGQLPRCFDWRNVNGTNFDSPLKKQGDCGSCYSVATLSSIESRIRIKTNNQMRPILSSSSVIGCSRYNQGCNGGYPHLVAKYGREFGIFEEHCSPYAEIDTVCKEQCSNIWKIKDYGYVGKGYYGSTSEEAMMREIQNRGPVVVAINAAPDLYYYSKGVFLTNPENPLIQSNNHPEVKAWQYTNHAVVCVGWGEQMHEGKILKYWILKNSWGEDWGEKGYFKMLRGVNLGAVENQSVFADPEI